MGYKTLIWGCGHIYNKIYNCIKLQEISGKIDVIGITANMKIYSQVDGYSFIDRNSLSNYQIDVIIVAVLDYISVYKDVIKYTTLSKDRIISWKALLIPKLDLERYLGLVESHISIIANNCWGGLVYHSLGMRFRSPFINMFLMDHDYIKLLSDLERFLGYDLMFVKMCYEDVLKREYPVCSLNGEIELHFNHYTSYREVKRKWDARLNRLNKNNLFIMMQTDDPESAKKFDRLEYEKKVCFVPNDMEISCLKNALKMNITRFDKNDYPLWKVVNGTADGQYVDYDILKLLGGNLNHDRICI